MLCSKNLEISCTHKHIFHVAHRYLTFIEIKYRKVGNWFTEAITDCKNMCVTHTHTPHTYTIKGKLGPPLVNLSYPRCFPKAPKEQIRRLPSSFLMRFFSNNFAFIHCQLTANVSHRYASSKKYTWQPRTDIEKIWRCVSEAVPQHGGTHQADEKMLVITSGGKSVTFLWIWSKFNTNARNTPMKKSTTPRITTFTLWLVTEEMYGPHFLGRGDSVSPSAMVS